MVVFVEDRCSSNSTFVARAITINFVVQHVVRFVHEIECCFFRVADFGRKQGNIARVSA